MRWDKWCVCCSWVTPSFMYECLPVAAEHWKYWGRGLRKHGMVRDDNNPGNFFWKLG